MRRRSPAGPRVANLRLVVPAVEPDDVGLVLAVHGVIWDRDIRRWWLVAPEGRMYRVPAELSDWASRLDYDVRQRIIRYPTVFAFRSTGGTASARILAYS